MIAQWISTSALGVYPPMSRWVYALTFLRSTSQGVEADSSSSTGSLPLWIIILRLLRCFRCHGCTHVNKRDDRFVDKLYAALCCSWACRIGPNTSFALYSFCFVPSV
ncbi:hypothetical protein EDM57_22785 [Brevibacillus gelatini]|uniref:Uncharacterized protein n=1 Tax=Brevibacillus gelatini TaxID=1655277 RepID=A0A3M8AIV8_9BACL|nr:hypothetical protein EDM57_22785 [Brevibacillus gelatini]